MRRMLLGAILVIAAAFGYAENPTVSIIRVQQRYPWDGCVDIDYTISGLEHHWVDYRLALSVTSGGVTSLCSNFWSHAPGDLPTAEGTHRVTWDASKDAPSLNARDVSFKLAMQYAPITEAMGDYMVIDVSGGPDATNYPVRYIKGDGILPAGFNNRMYKTDKIVLKKVKACKFRMNDPNSGATKWVQLTHDYFVGLFEVTQTQYKLVTGTNPSTSDGYDTVANDAIRPVESITWNTLMAGDNTFLTRISGKARYKALPVTGLTLPTEAQWECACRAGTTTKYHFGDSDENARQYEVFGPAEYAGPRVGNLNSVVGSKLPNPWGFYDMLGNVNEFCSDYYAGYGSGYTEENPEVDPKGPESGTSIVYRGGSWRSDPCLACGGRINCGPDSVVSFGGDINGFRLSRTLP